MKVPSFLCQTPQFSCFGCCGHHYKNEKGIKRQIELNTAVFKRKSLPLLQKRSEKLSTSGICKSIILQKNKPVCGLHPMQHKGIDHRDKLCEKDYFCATMRKWQGDWDERTKRKFLEYVTQKHDDWFAYSMNMDDDSYLREFEENL